MQELLAKSDAACPHTCGSERGANVMVYGQAHWDEGELQVLRQHPQLHGKVPAEGMHSCSFAHNLTPSSPPVRTKSATT